MTRNRRHHASACDPCSAATRPLAAALDDPHADKQSRSYKAVAVGAGASGAMAVGAIMISAVAVGAVAIGALAIGRLAIKRLSVRRSHIDGLVIDDLSVRRLRVEEVIITKRYVMPDDDAADSNSHGPNADGG